MIEIPIIAAIWYPDESTPFNKVNNVEGVVLCGFRHGHIMGQFYSLTSKRTPTVKHVQGFLTNKNNFVDRKEAHKMWLDAGKTAEFSDELYSEDLY